MVTNPISIDFISIDIHWYPGWLSVTIPFFDEKSAPDFPGCAVPRTTMAWFRNWPGPAMGAMGIAPAISSHGWIRNHRKLRIFMGKVWENMGKYGKMRFDMVWHHLKLLDLDGNGWSFGDVKFNQTVLLKYDQFMSAKKYCLDSRQFVAFFAWLNLMLATCLLYFCYPTQ